jgi:hypothetical protein
MGSAASSSAEIQMPRVTRGKVGSGGVGVRVGITSGGRKTKGVGGIGVEVLVGGKGTGVTADRTFLAPKSVKAALQAVVTAIEIATMSRRQLKVVYLMLSGPLLCAIRSFSSISLSCSGFDSY